MTPPVPYNLDVVATRGDLVESRHSVSAAVVDSSGRLVGYAGDPSLVTCWRSCAKPFQVMPFLESGHFDRLGWTENHLALACASHGGEPEHVSLAESMLRSVELEEGDLACGAHEPLSRRGSRLLQQSGDRPTRLHNNCSGKHAAMLAFACTAGYPVLGYQNFGHSVQHAIVNVLVQWTGVAEEDIEQVVDGCGVVAFGLPLQAMALAFARLGAGAQDSNEIPARIVTAMRAQPFLVGGTDRFDTVLMEETGGSVVAKVGAEGVHTVAVPDARLGFAVKAEDGAARAQYVAVLRMLQHLGVLQPSLPPRLAAFLRIPIQNTRGEIVGEVRPAA
ncbi:MAG: asparaginase [Gemmatimonadaceae bacterium]